MPTCLSASSAALVHRSPIGTRHAAMPIMRVSFSRPQSPANPHAAQEYDARQSTRLHALADFASAGPVVSTPCDAMTCSRLGVLTRCPHPTAHPPTTHHHNRHTTRKHPRPRFQGAQPAIAFGVPREPWPNAAASRPSTLSDGLRVGFRRLSGLSPDIRRPWGDQTFDEPTARPGLRAGDRRSGRPQGVHAVTRSSSVAASAPRAPRAASPARSSRSCAVRRSIQAAAFIAANATQMPYREQGVRVGDFAVDQHDVQEPSTVFSPAGGCRGSSLARSVVPDDAQAR
jgi:hypothetical protein